MRNHTAHFRKGEYPQKPRRGHMSGINLPLISGDSEWMCVPKLDSLRKTGRLTMAREPVDITALSTDAEVQYLNYRMPHPCTETPQHHRYRAGFKSSATDPLYIAQVATKFYTLTVKAWKLDDSDAERLLDVDKETWLQIKNGTWSKPLAQEQLMRISAVIGLHRALHSHFDESPANSWVKRPNTEPIFSGRKPLDVMIKGRLPMMIRVRRYMNSSLIV